MRKNKSKNQQLLVRDIIDIDSTYEDFEALEDNDELKVNNKKSKVKVDKKEDDKKHDDEKKKM